MREICVGPSGMAVNDRPVLQLQLIWNAGKPFGLLTGRPEPELYWLASELRRRLSISAG